MSRILFRASGNPGAVHTIASRSMASLYNGIQQHVKPDERLVVLARHVQVHAPELLNVALLLT
jgi:hypothetical protein